MKIKTTRFGEIEIPDKDLITMPQGIIGFQELKRYVILDHEKDSPFKWLQSIDDGSIAFVLINPLTFKPDYEVEVSESEIKELELESEEDAVISVIVTIPSNPKNMTANLKGPLIFNLKNRRGKQIVLMDQKYTTRHNIMEEVKKLSKKDVKEEQKEKAAKKGKKVAAKTEKKQKTA